MNGASDLIDHSVKSFIHFCENLRFRRAESETVLQMKLNSLSIDLDKIETLRLSC